jgi:hypothetical protein
MQLSQVTWHALDKKELNKTNNNNNNHPLIFYFKIQNISDYAQLYIYLIAIEAEEKLNYPTNSCYKDMAV